MNNHRIRKVAIILLASMTVFIAGWVATYPDAGDPKNIKYVFVEGGAV